eukprot:gene27163-2402_t
MASADSIALVAFKQMLETEEGSLYIDPSSLGFFNEAGEGDFVVVEKGYWTPPGQCTIVVCIKSFKPGVVKSAADVKSLVQGAKSLLPASQRCLSRTLGVGCYQNATMLDIRSSIFLVEEWAGTTTLRKAIRNSVRQPVPRQLFYEMEDGLRWCLEIAEALQCLHELNIVHADIKLENIMLAEADTGHVTDSMAVLVDIKPYQSIFIESCNKALKASMKSEGGDGGEDTDDEAESFTGTKMQRNLSRFSIRTDASVLSDATKDGSVYVCSTMSNGVRSSITPTAVPKVQDKRMIRRSMGAFPSFKASADDPSKEQNGSVLRLGRCSEQPSMLRSNTMSAGLSPDKDRSVHRQESGVAERSSQQARVEFALLWKQASSRSPRLTYEIPSHRTSFTGCTPCSASPWGKMAEGHEGAKAVWVGRGRMWRRSSWDFSDMDLRLKAQHRVRGDSEKRSNQMIEEAADEVARAQAAGHGGLSQLLRSLQADVEFLMEMGRSAHPLSTEAEEGVSAQCSRPAVGSNGVVIKSALKRTSATDTSGKEMLSPHAISKVTDSLHNAASYSSFQEALKSQHGAFVEPPKKVRFTVPQMEVGKATTRDLSLLYRAPEFYGKASFTPTLESDVYALAVLFYEVLIRMVITPETTTQESVEAYQKKAFGGFREPMPPMWPQEIKDLLTAAWAHDPKERASIFLIVKMLKEMQSDVRLLTGLVYPNGTLPSDKACCTIS